ncbi:hypothetical protein AgCh_009758 [Apium graveolens]
MGSVPCLAVDIIAAIAAELSDIYGKKDRNDPDPRPRIWGCYKGANIWDTFASQTGKILDFSNANTTVDHYHRFKTDIDLMKDMGMDAYIFSISWSRKMNGTGEPNSEGLKYYNNLFIIYWKKVRIQPYVTLYHWDLPQMLEDRYEGWLNDHIVKDFEHYAFTYFKAFGDRVKYWITFNEPHNAAMQGYNSGTQAPGNIESMLLVEMGLKEMVALKVFL